MTAKTQRKTNAETVSYKVKSPKKARSTTPKTTSRLNGKHLLAAYEDLRVGVVQSSLTGTYIDANEEFCRILGYSKKELLQLGIRDCTHEDDYALDSKLHEQLVSGKIPFYGLEKRYMRKDGQIVWVELTRSLVRDANGKPLSTIGTIIDISEYKHVERVLRDSAENLRIATEAAQMFKWELDFQKQLYTFSDNFVHALGFSAGLLPQNSVETVWKLSPEEDVRTISEAIAKAIQDHRDLHSLQYRLIDPESGQTVWLEVNAKVVYDGHGNAQRMFGVAQNITERKRSERALAEFARQQQALYQLSDRLHHTNSLGDVYDAALDAILNGLQCDRASILLFDDTKVMHFVAWRGLSDEYRKATEGHSPWGPNEKNPYPVCVSDIPTSDFSDTLKAAIQAEGIGSLMFIPLMSNGRLIGKFMVYFNEARECNDVEVELSLMIARQLAFGVERIKAENALRAGEAKLQVELADMKLLQVISSQLIQEDKIDALYEQIIDAARFLMRSDMASMQMFYPERNGLQLLAWKGFDPQAAAFWEWVNVDSSSSCAVAMNTGERVIVPDVEASGFIAGTQDLEFYHLCGIRSMQSTPLISRDGRLVGMISTHWRETHEPSERELHLFDVLARQAADLVERKQAEETLRIRARQQQAVARFGELAVRERDLQKVFDHAAVMVTETLKIEYCKILELLENKESLLLRAGVGWRPGLVGSAKMSAGLGSQAGYTLVSNTPVVVADFREEQRFSNPPLLSEHGVVSGMSCLIHGADGKPWGVIGAHATRRTDFTQDDVNFLTAMANILGDAIQRQHADQALQQSEKRYRAVVESQTEMVCRFKPDGTILFINEAYARARGVPAEKLIDANFWEFISVEDRPAIQGMLDHLTPETPEARIENHFQTMQGERWTLWTNRALRFDDNGHLLEGQATGIDITDRKRAEEQLRQSESRLQAMFAQAGVGVVLMEADCNMLQVNPKFCEIVGYEESELIGTSCLQMTHVEDQAENIRVIDELLAGTEETTGLEKRYIRKDGSIVWVQLNIAKIKDAGGSMKQLVAVVEDITKRKLAEEQLRKSAEFDAFRLALTDALRPLSDPQEILSEAMRVLGEKLQADRLLYSEIEEDNETILILDNYVKEGVSKLTGRASLNDYGKARRTLSAGQNLIIVDAATSPDMDEKDRVSFAALGIRSGLAIPLIKGGRWAATLGVQHGAVRVWTENEIKFVEETAERTWSALERARAQEKLRTSETLYRAIARSIPGGGVYVVDKDFRYRVAEGPVTEAFGLSREALEGQTVWQAFPDERGKRMKERLEQTFAGETVNFETEHQGRVYWTRHAPLQDSLGQAIIVTIDITERKRAEEALKIENERFMRFVDSNIVGILIGDASGKVILANDYYLRLLGLSRQDFVDGKVDWKKFTPPEWLPADEKAVQQLRERGVCDPYEKEYVRTDGTRVPVYVADAMLPGPGEEIAAFVLDITERKQAEEALRQSEERFARFMQHLPGLAWIKDIQGHYIYANAAAENAFSTPREKLYGRTDLEIFPVEIAAQFKKNDEQALVNEKGMQTVETLPQGDGLVHYSLVTKFPIPGPDGSTALIGGTAFDITERLQAEEALRESEERFKAILRQATAGIVRKDAQGRFIFVNEAFCEMLGYTEEELLGKTVWEFMHPDDVAENKRSFDRLMNQGLPFKLERRFLRKDGSIIWVDASVSPLVDSDGRPQSAVAVEVDITGRKQAEEALQQLNLQLESRVQKRTATIQAINQSLREEIAERKRIEEALRVSESLARASEEKLRTLFDLLPVGISFLDPQGKIIQMNSALPQILKLSKEQLLHQEHKSRKFIRANGTPMPLTEFAGERVLTEGRTVYNVETGIILENGEMIWTSVSAAPVDVAEVGVVVVTVDITEKKRAEQALQESHARLRVLSQRLVEVQEEERRALARELHDRVGQTLAALNINLIIINSQLSPDLAQQIGARLEDSMKLVGETIALIRDVMTDLRPAVLDDYGLEAALESHLAQYTSRYNIKTTFEKPDHPLPRLGPSAEMTFLRITQEALMNIAKHAHAEHVHLSLRQEEESICLTIQDDGVGIESWQDANRPGSHGLTIMRERAEAFGGSLRVDSVPGQGTTVQAIMPFRNDRQAQTKEEQYL